VQLRSSGEPVLFLNNPDGYGAADRRRVIATVQQLNDADRDHHADIATRLPRKCLDVDQAWPPW